mmetsp:Transcript_76294/g.223662  ORF Transcript_76294/g.223662 Transcript_76294/m.223662 type:complete len:296 (-) Transcript_76294:560-1447(-)
MNQHCKLLRKCVHVGFQDVVRRLCLLGLLLSSMLAGLEAVDPFQELLVLLYQLIGHLVQTLSLVAASNERLEPHAHLTLDVLQQLLHLLLGMPLLGRLFPRCSSFLEKTRYAGDAFRQRTRVKSRHALQKQVFILALQLGELGTQGGGFVPEYLSLFLGCLAGLLAHISLSQSVGELLLCPLAQLLFARQFLTAKCQLALEVGTLCGKRLCLLQEAVLGAGHLPASSFFCLTCTLGDTLVQCDVCLQRLNLQCTVALYGRLLAEELAHLRLRLGELGTRPIREALYALLLHLALG